MRARASEPVRPLARGAVLVAEGALTAAASVAGGSGAQALSSEASSTEAAGQALRRSENFRYTLAVAAGWHASADMV